MILTNRKLKFSLGKGAAINYIESEIRNFEGQEEFEIDENEIDMAWEIGGHWEITEQKIIHSYDYSEHK
jgi:hypothetical protein